MSGDERQRGHARSGGGKGRGKTRHRGDAPGPKHAPVDPRRLAVEVLARVEAGAFADVLVGERLTRSLLDPREAALFTRLVYGTEASRGRLDWTLAGLARRPLADLNPAVRAALRLGLFQLLLLDRVPAHAAVDTTVALVKQSAGAGAASFANAVLRGFLRRGERELPDATQEPDAHLAIRWSHPEWLVRLWRAELGDARTAAVLEANAEPAPTVARIDPADASRDEIIARLAARGIAAHATSYASHGLVVDAPVAAFGREPGLALQGEASQLVIDVLDPRPGERVLDLCAAPGGKTGAIAERTSPAHVFAADRSRPGVRRIAVLPAARAGRVLPLVADASAPPFRGTFDAVLVDAPCSGLGTLRAHPEIRWRRTPEDLEHLAERQEAILASAADLVRPGGRLVYATCTMARVENERVVERLLASHPDFRLADARPHLPEAARGLAGDDGLLRTSPDVGGLDGFFAARLERN
jgi:16S rRNA (cytosine967-C5)-methyltransferase